MYMQRSDSIFRPPSAGFGNWSEQIAPALGGCASGAGVGAVGGPYGALAGCLVGGAAGVLLRPGEAPRAGAMAQSVPLPQPQPAKGIPTWVWLVGGGVLLVGIVGALAATR
jgi:hypothetical protein